jgi:hypothetical protein
MKEQSDIVPLSDQARAILLGSLLGDGSLKIHKGYSNARFSFRHSSAQQEYFEWKAERLKEIASTKSVFEQPSDGFSNKPKLRFQSRALPSLTELYELTHKGKRFRIRRKWLNQMTALSLAIWWFDDGSIISNGRKGVLCTDGFDKESQNLLRRYLKKVWDVDVRLGQIGSKRMGTKDEYYRLWFRSTSELQKFLQIILPYTPTSMIQKVLLLYKDAKLQQRWISEVAKATGFSQQTVEEAMKQKKQKWKIFRE